MAVGTELIDLDEAADALSADVDPALLTTGRLDGLLAAGAATWTGVREAIAERLGSGRLDRFRHPRSGLQTALAWGVGDFVDFYSSIHHAGNVGRMFRPGKPELFPNWRHLPVGYHGRAGTVVVDGTPVARPRGQYRTESGLEYAPSGKLDFEAELGWVVGGSTSPGETVKVDDAPVHLFGLVLLNDWSARDIQSWETTPLGPFLGKSFATSVSAWVMPLPALEPARVVTPPQDPPPMEHLASGDRWSFDVDVEVWIRPGPGREEHRVAAMNAGEGLYWNPAQQLAHLTSNGTPLRPGDLLGTGTISGTEPSQWGSMLELSWNGTQPVEVGDGLSRTFLEDGDEVSLRGSFPIPGGRGPLGPVSGVVEPPPPL